MTNTDLKEQLISRIQITDDKDILMGVLELLEFELNHMDTFYLTEEQKASIVLSKQQIQEGKVLTDDEADKLEDKWLNE